MLRLLCTVLAFGASIVTGLPKASNEDSCTSLQYGANYVVSSSHIAIGGIANISAVAAQNVTETNTASFCRILGQIPYGPNNTLNFEIWLPEAENYNERYLSIGNGGFGGVIDYRSMASYLNAGFSVGGCDAGHLTSENGPSRPGGYVPFLNSYAQTRAWIRDSIAMFSAPAKAITASFYDCAPKKAYYAGCSTGGAQGYALAQYHPEVFDGIVAACAGNWYTGLMASFMWNGLYSNKPGAFLTQDTLSFVRDAVVEQCDEIDGVKDGVIDDPTTCNFDTSSLLCQANQPQISNNKTVCLNETQLATVDAIYAGPGEGVYPGFGAGSEAEWLVQENELWTDYAVPILQNLVFKNLSYDYMNFDFDKDVKTMEEVAGPLITAISPRLDAFKARGGKLLATQGWADPFNAPTWPIDHHNQAKAIYGSDQLNSFWRLFMAPGSGHCGSAASYPQVPGTIHYLDALIPWVEEGVAPGYVVASKPADGSNATKKLCAYPGRAVFRGGDGGRYESFDCV